MARVALFFGCGVASSSLGSDALPILLFLVVLAPIVVWRRPLRALLLVLVSVAGWLHASAGTSACPSRMPTSPVGFFEATPRTGSAPFRLVGSNCVFTAVVSTDHSAPAGRMLRLEGDWVVGTRAHWLRVRSLDTAGPTPSAPSGRRGEGGLQASSVRWRDGLVGRLHDRYGQRAPMVAALILARKEGLDRTLRDGFAQTGIVHLLAISGFHVGVVTGMVLALLRLVRVTRSRSALVAVGVIWAYVGLIGAPAAAVRAALILSFVSLARALNRPTARWGPLGAALLVSLVWDPDALRSAGFQLSFAGAAGLLAWTRPIERALRALLGHRVPGLLQALATGIAATAATLPFVVWHFEQLSLVGIPATLLASPLVALAVPGALVSLALEAVHSGAAAFVAGGVDSLLAVLESGVRRLSATSWASVWLPRRAIVVPIAAGLAGVLVQRRLGRTRGLAGRTGAALWACVMLTLWPLVADAVQRGTVEVVVFDVGQGDAIGIRTPRGRWILVDTGPRTNAAASRTSVARHLRRRGVEHLETMVLTHADADHIGDGAEVLRSLTVGEVIDPGLVTGKPGYLEVLHAARDRDIPWRAARAGHEWAIDGLVLRILAPLPGLATGDTETNAASVVLHLRFGDFDALLMGDAPQSVEHALMDAFDGNVEVLKVGHHGSSTSTADAWLDRTRPKAAIVSVGRGNRYGHPAADVMTRLRRWGVPVHRTDLDGTVSVRGRPDGTFFVRTTR